MTPSRFHSGNIILFQTISLKRGESYGGPFHVFFQRWISEFLQLTDDKRQHFSLCIILLHAAVESQLRTSTQVPFGCTFTDFHFDPPNTSSPLNLRGKKLYFLHHYIIYSITVLADYDFSYKTIWEVFLYLTNVFKLIQHFTKKPRRLEKSKKKKPKQTKKQISDLFCDPLERPNT